MAYPFGGSTAASMGVWFTPRIRRFSHKSNPQLLIIPRILESLGYRVLTAENGRQAKEVAEAKSFDLPITDLVMPEMGGRALINYLKERNPRLKAIAVTGYAVENEVHNLAVDVIQKPLDLQGLSHAIRRALDTE